MRSARQLNSILRGRCFRLLILAICLFVLSEVDDFVVSARETENPPVRIGRIAPGRHGIIIHTDRIRLPILLKEIAVQSRVNFRINNSLWNELVTVDVKASNWSDAVIQVLAKFDHMDLWSDTRELSGVYVMGKLSDFDPSLTGTRFAKGKTKLNALPVSKLEKLAQVRSRDHFPIKLWADREIRVYLRRYGISTKSDLNSSKVIMQVRRAVRKELRVILDKKARVP